MKRQNPPFSMLELLKMVRRLDDSINKIQRVADKLALGANAKEIILLTQAIQSLLRIRNRLAAEAEKSLEALAKTGVKIPTVGISEVGFLGENIHLHAKRAFSPSRIP